MKFRIIIIPIIFFLLTSCEQYTLKKSSEVNFKPEKKYNNTGFSLIYNENLSPAFIVFENYEIILKWNRSLRFSLAVCTLKDKLKNEL